MANVIWIMNILYKILLRLLGFPFGFNVKIKGDRKRLKVGQNVVFDGKVIIDLTKGGEITIGKNTIIMEGVIINPFGGKITIGNSCSINPYCVIYGHGGLNIGNFVRIATHTIIIPANHVFDSIDIPIYRQGLTTKGVVIEEDVWLGAGVTILDGVSIGKGSIIAAGAVIKSSIEPLSIYGGIPGKLLKKRI